jgi:hypothetical protein
MGTAFSGGLLQGLAQGLVTGKNTKHLAQRNELLKLQTKQAKKSLQWEEEFAQKDPSGYNEWLLRGRKAPSAKENLFGVLAARYGAGPGAPPADGGQAPTVAAPQGQGDQLLSDLSNPLIRLLMTGAGIDPTKLAPPKTPQERTLVPPEVARETGLSPAETYAEALSRRPEGIRLPTEQQKRQIQPVPAQDLVRYTDKAGKPPRAPMTYGELDKLLADGTLRLAEKATAGESVQRLAPLVPLAAAAIRRTEQALFKNGKLDAALLQQLELVPKDPRSWTAKGLRLTKLLPKARMLVQDLSVALQPIARLLSGGVIGEEEFATFYDMYVPATGDSDERVRQKLTGLKEVYNKLKKATNPNDLEAVFRDAVMGNLETQQGPSRYINPKTGSVIMWDEKAGEWVEDPVHSRKKQ